MKRRSLWHVALAIVFAVFGLLAWGQVAANVLFGSGAPTILTALQALVGTAAFSAAFGIWIGARWAPVAAVAYGAITGGMIIALGPLLELDAAARRGLWSGAASVVAVGLLSAWWLRRTLRATAPAASTSSGRQ